MRTHYILNAAGEVEPVADWREWAVWFEANREARIVDRTELDGGVWVSTVFLGLDHNWGDGPPLLFETMIFEGKWDQYQWRWTTRVQAQAGHDRIVAALRDAAAPEDVDA